jgi:hypothetical protein
MAEHPNRTSKNQVNIRLDDRDFDWLYVYAKEARLTLAAAMRKLISQARAKSTSIQ